MARNNPWLRLRRHPPPHRPLRRTSGIVVVHHHRSGNSGQPGNRHRTSTKDLQFHYHWPCNPFRTPLYMYKQDISRHRNSFSRRTSQTLRDQQISFQYTDYNNLLLHLRPHQTYHRPGIHVQCRPRNNHRLRIFQAYCRPCHPGILHRQHMVHMLDLRCPGWWPNTQHHNSQYMCMSDNLRRRNSQCCCLR